MIADEGIMVNESFVVCELILENRLICNKLNNLFSIDIVVLFSVHKNGAGAIIDNSIDGRR